MAARLSLSKFYNILILLSLGMGCSKVGLIKLEPSLALGQAYWFEEEKTLFVFYRVTREEPFDDLGRVEVNFEGNGDGRKTYPGEWDDVSSLATPEAQVTDSVDPETFWHNAVGFKSLHTHLPVDCGTHERCGSLSVNLAHAPDSVKLRYRFHADGIANTTWELPNIQVSGRFFPHSFFVYGVFDQSNRFTRWQGQHAFPSLSHQEAVALGLRRWFEVDRVAWGVAEKNDPFPHMSLFGSAEDCSGLTALGDEASVHSDDGSARWSKIPLPTAAFDTPEVCSIARFSDGTGKPRQFTAFARKNPIVSPVKTILNSHSHETQIIRVKLTLCHGAKDQAFEDFQAARLLFTGGEPTICLDEPNTFDRYFLANQLYKIIKPYTTGEPMSLSLVMPMLHRETRDRALLHDEVQAGLAITRAELPEIAAVLVYDSVVKTTINPELLTKVVWCPIFLGPSVPQACRALPDKAQLGPINIKLSPLLPTLEGFHGLSDEQRSGSEITQLTIRAPAQSQNLAFELMDRPDANPPPEFPEDPEKIQEKLPHLFSYSTNDGLAVNADQALSYCADGDPYGLLGFKPQYEGINPDQAVSASPLMGIGFAHNTAGLDALYHLGIIWQLPFLLELRYKTKIKGGIGSGKFVIPLGFTPRSDELIGDEVWDFESIDVSQALTKCHEFCNHPVFLENGVYAFRNSWRSKQAVSCYRPHIPVNGEGEHGFD